jgi:hypothetical protein
MSMEQRVKTLEYEMKILKNEIQQTLLDIQEQILLHYYSSLRTEETAPLDGLRQSVEAIQKKKIALEEEQEVSKYISEDETIA